MRQIEAVRRACVAIAAGAVVMLPGAALAQASTAPPAGAPVVHPENGQTPEAQNQDERACTTSATRQSGYDPRAVAQERAASVGTGWGAEMSRGGAKGGANGAGAGAAMGAAAGDPAAQELSATSEEKLASYEKAFSACMQDRGYTVE